MSNKGFYDKSKIQTGRTTRMMQHAIEQAESGRAVYVVFSTMEEISLIKRDQRWRDKVGLLKLETPDSMRLDWGVLRGPGMHINCVVLVDHHVIERKFGLMLEMLNKFDKNEG